MFQKVTNRNISNQNPEKYLIELAQYHHELGKSAEFDRRLYSCFIPYQSSEPNFKQYFQIDHFEAFLNARAEMIIDRIKEVVGDAWKEPQEDVT